MDKWSQKTDVNIDEIRLWSKLYPYSENTGILTANTPTIDIDIMIPEAAQAIEDLARDMFEERGPIFVRFGKPPKRAIPLRTDRPFKKLTTSLLGPDGKLSETKVEILCEGQQVVVHGIHPDTAKPYSWHPFHLLEIAKWDDLPYIHPEEALTFIQRSAEILVRDFGFAYPPQQQQQQTKANGAGEFRHADWSALVANIIAGAELHDSIRDLAASFAAYDVPFDSATRILQSLMLASAVPHDDRWQDRFNDILRALASGYDKFRQSTAKAAVLKFLDISQWDLLPRPIRTWAVHELIPCKQASLLSGEGSVGKTILELQLCVAHVLGLDWVGCLPEKGPVIYLGAEDDADELRLRLDQIVKHYQACRPNENICFKTLADNGLHLLSFAGEDCVLGVPNRNGQIVATPLYQKLLEAVQDIKPKHIGIDTSADTFGGNEIDRAQVRQYVGMLRKLAISCGGCVVLLSHPSLTGINTGTGLSGSTGWHNSVRARIYFKTIEDDEGGTLRELEFKKNNYGPVSRSIKVEYRNGVFARPDTMSEHERRARDRRIDDLFLAVFRKLVAQGCTSFSLSKNAPSGEYVPKQIASHPDAREFKPHDYEGAMWRLRDRGEVHVTKNKKGRETLALGPKPEDTS